MKSDELKRSLVVTQDIKIVKALSGNDPKIRERALKNLGKWLEVRSSKISFTEDEFIRIWKGLFYSMWMSDKPLVQEQCAENISHLVHFSDIETSLRFFKCGLIVLATEWFGIDQLRLDKFLMFVRRVLRQALVVLRNDNWQVKSVTHFGEILTETVLQNNDTNGHLGLTMHIIEIFCEELAKVSKGELTSSQTTQFLKPFIKLLATLDDIQLIAHMKKYLFHHLLQQSDEGIEYQAKFQAWKGEGFPGGTIDAMQSVGLADDETPSDEEIDDQVLDPRAGEVDVVLPQLKFDGKVIAKLLLESKFVNGSTTKSRDALSRLAKKFRKLSKGNFPLGVKKLPVIKEDGYSTNIRKSINRLVKFEKQLHRSNNRKRKIKDSQLNSSQVPSKKIKVNGTNDFENKLEKFIRKSEGSLVTKPKKRKSSILEKDSSRVIYRNSGMWLVEPLDSSNVDLSIDESNHIPTEINCSPSVAFPQSEWDSPPKEGEVEIFVPANKYKRKIEKIAEMTGRRSSLLLEKKLEKLVKPRYSLDSKLVKNPFANKKIFTPKSEKKVKINLKLNSSQEMYEHRAQLRKSPGIPFDASRKPIKPLLKSNLNSPINPFCKT